MPKQKPQFRSLLHAATAYCLSGKALSVRYRAGNVQADCFAPDVDGITLRQPATP